MQRVVFSPNRLSARAIAFTLVIAMTLSLSLSDLSRANALDPSLFTLRAESVSIPSELGHVEEFFQGRGNRLVIYIQDAHANYSAQKHIASAIGHFSDQYDIPLVALEAADGEVDVSLFRSFPVPEITEQVLDKRMRTGEIGGPEFALTMSKKNIEAVGVDGEDLYLKNFKEFMAVMDDQKEGLEFTKNVRTAFESLRSVTYSKEHKELDRILEAHRRDVLDIASLARALREFSTELKIDTKTFSEIQKLFAFLDESNIQEADQNKIRDYMASIDAEALFLDIERLSLTLKLKMSGTNTERRLITLEHYLNLLERGFELTLTRRDVKELKELAKEMCAERIFSFLERAAVENRVRLGPLSVVRDIPIDSYVEHILIFYQTTVKRDEHFAKALLTEMQKKRASSALMIAGGYHRQGLTERLRKQGISYVVVMPKVDEVGEHEKYLELMKKGANLLHLPSRNTLGFGIRAAPSNAMIDLTGPIFNDLLARASQPESAAYFQTHGFGSLQEVVEDFTRSGKFIFYNGDRVGDRSLFREMLRRSANSETPSSSAGFGAILERASFSVHISDPSVLNAIKTTQDSLLQTSSAGFGAADISEDLRNAREVLKNYDVGTIHSIKPLDGGRGELGKSLLIETDRGKFKLKPITNQIFPDSSVEDVALYETSAVGEMLRRGFPVASPITTSTGKYFSSANGKAYILYDFILGDEFAWDWNYVNVSSARQASMVRFLAKMHRDMQGFDPQGQRNQDSLLQTLKHRAVDMAALKERLLDKKIDLPNYSYTKSEKLFLQSVDFILDQFEWLDTALLDSLPTALVHGDLHPGNAVFKGDEVKTAFDWDHLRKDFRLWDLFQGAFDYLNPDALEAALRVYHAENPLTPGEWQAIPEIIRLKLLDLLSRMVTPEKIYERHQYADDLKGIDRLEQALFLMEKDAGLFNWMQKNIRALTDTNAQELHGDFDRMQEKITSSAAGFGAAGTANSWAEIKALWATDSSRITREILGLISPEIAEQKKLTFTMLPYFLSRAQRTSRVDQIDQASLSIYKKRLITERTFLKLEKSRYEELNKSAKASVSIGIYPLEYEQYVAERMRIKGQIAAMIDQKMERGEKNILLYFVGPSTGEEVLSVAGILYQVLQEKAVTDWKEWDIQLIGLERRVDLLRSAVEIFYSTRNANDHQSSQMAEVLLKTGAFVPVPLGSIPKRLIESDDISFKFGHHFKPIPSVRKWLTYVRFNLFDEELIKTIASIGKADMTFSRNNFRWNLQSDPKSWIHEWLLGQLPSEEDRFAFERLGQITRDRGIIVTEPLEDLFRDAGYRHPGFEPIDHPKYGMYIKLGFGARGTVDTTPSGFGAKLFAPPEAPSALTKRVDEIILDRKKIADFINAKEISSIRYEIVGTEDDFSGYVLRFVVDTDAGQKIFYAKLKHSSGLGHINPTLKEFQMTREASEAGLLPPSVVMPDALLVREVENGMSLKDIPNHPDWANFFLQNREYFMKKVGQVYGKLNEKLGILQVDIQLEHIFVTKSGQVFLIDLSTNSKGFEERSSLSVRVSDRVYIKEIDLRNLKWRIAGWLYSTQEMGGLLRKKGEFNLSTDREWLQWIEEGYHGMDNVAFHPMSGFGAAAELQINETLTHGSSFAGSFWIQWFRNELVRFFDGYKALFMVRNLAGKWLEREFDGRYIGSQIFKSIFQVTQSSLDVLKAFSKRAELSAKVFENNGPLTVSGIIGSWFRNFSHAGMVSNGAEAVNLFLTNIKLHNKQYSISPTTSRVYNAGFGAAPENVFEWPISVKGGQFEQFEKFVETWISEIHPHFSSDEFLSQTRTELSPKVTLYHKKQSVDGKQGLLVQDITWQQRGVIAVMEMFIPDVGQSQSIEFVFHPASVTVKMTENQKESEEKLETKEIPIRGIRFQKDTFTVLLSKEVLTLLTPYLPKLHRLRLVEKGQSGFGASTAEKGSSLQAWFKTLRRAGDHGFEPSTDDVNAGIAVNSARDGQTDVARVFASSITDSKRRREIETAIHRIENEILGRKSQGGIQESSGFGAEGEVTQQQAMDIWDGMLNELKTPEEVFTLVNYTAVNISYNQALESYVKVMAEPDVSREVQNLEVIMLLRSKYIDKVGDVLHTIQARIPEFNKKMVPVEKVLGTYAVYDSMAAHVERLIETGASEEALESDWNVRVAYSAATDAEHALAERDLFVSASDIMEIGFGARGTVDATSSGFGAANDRMDKGLLPSRRTILIGAVVTSTTAALGIGWYLIERLTTEEWQRFKPEPTLESAKQAVLITLDWLKDNGFPDTAMLDRYAKAVKEGTDVIPPGKQDSVLASMFQKIVLGGKVTVNINSQRIYQYFRALQKNGSTDLFLEVFASLIVQEAAGLDLMRVADAENSEVLKVGKRIYVDELRKHFSSGGIEWPSKSMLEFINKFQKEIHVLATVGLAGEFYEMQRRSQFFTWAKQKGLYSAEKTEKEFQRLRLRKETEDAFNLFNAYRPITKELLKTEGRENEMLTLVMRQTLSAMLLRFERGEYNAVDWIHVSRYGFFAYLEFERYRATHGAEGIDEQLLGLLQQGKLPPLGMLQSAAQRLLPQAKTLISQWESRLKALEKQSNSGFGSTRTTKQKLWHGRIKRISVAALSWFAGIMPGLTGAKLLAFAGLAASSGFVGACGSQSFLDMGSPVDWGLHFINVARVRSWGPSQTLNVHGHEVAIYDKYPDDLKNFRFSKVEIQIIRDTLEKMKSDDLNKVHWIGAVPEQVDIWGQAFGDGFVLIMEDAPADDETPRTIVGHEKAEELKQAGKSIGSEKAAMGFEYIAEVVEHETEHLRDNLAHDALWESLYARSGDDLDNYVREYGMTNRWEDRATVAEAWSNDSKGWLEFVLNRAASGKTILLEKFLAIMQGRILPGNILRAYGLHTESFLSAEEWKLAIGDDGWIRVGDFRFELNAQNRIVRVVSIQHNDWLGNMLTGDWTFSEPVASPFIDTMLSSNIERVGPLAPDPTFPSINPAWVSDSLAGFSWALHGAYSDHAALADFLETVQQFFNVEAGTLRAYERLDDGTVQPRDWTITIDANTIWLIQDDNAYIGLTLNSNNEIIAALYYEADYTGTEPWPYSFNPPIASPFIEKVLEGHAAHGYEDVNPKSGDISPSEITSTTYRSLIIPQTADIDFPFPEIGSENEIGRYFNPPGHPFGPPQYEFLTKGVEMAVSVSGFYTDNLEPPWRNNKAYSVVWYRASSAHEPLVYVFDGDRVERLTINEEGKLIVDLAYGEPLIVDVKSESKLFAPSEEFRETSDPASGFGATAALDDTVILPDDENISEIVQHNLAILNNSGNLFERGNAVSDARSQNPLWRVYKVRVDGNGRITTGEDLSGDIEVILYDYLNGKLRMPKETNIELIPKAFVESLRLHNAAYSKSKAAPAPLPANKEDAVQLQNEMMEAEIEMEKANAAGFEGGVRPALAEVEEPDYSKATEQEIVDELARQLALRETELTLSYATRDAQNAGLFESGFGIVDYDALRTLKNSDVAQRFNFKYVAVLGFEALSPVDQTQAAEIVAKLWPKAEFIRQSIKSFSKRVRTQLSASRLLPLFTLRKPVDFKGDWVTLKAAINADIQAIPEDVRAAVDFVRREAISNLLNAVRGRAFAISA